MLDIEWNACIGKLDWEFESVMSTKEAAVATTTTTTNVVNTQRLATSDAAGSGQNEYLVRLNYAGQRPESHGKIRIS